MSAIEPRRETGCSAPISRIGKSRFTPGCDVPVTQQSIEDVLAGRVELAWLDGQPVVITNEAVAS